MTEACTCGCAMQSQLSYAERKDFAMWSTEHEDGSKAHIGLLILVLTLLAEVVLGGWVFL